MTESLIYRISFAFLSSLPRHFIVSHSLLSESYTKEKRERSGFDSTHSTHFTKNSLVFFVFEIFSKVIDTK